MTSMIKTSLQTLEDTIVQSKENYEPLENKINTKIKILDELQEKTEKMYGNKLVVFQETLEKVFQNKLNEVSKRFQKQIDKLEEKLSQIQSCV